MKMLTILVLFVVSTALLASMVSAEDAGGYWVSPPDTNINLTIVTANSSEFVNILVTNSSHLPTNTTVGDALNYWQFDEWDLGPLGQIPIIVPYSNFLGGPNYGALYGGLYVMGTNPIIEMITPDLAGSAIAQLNSTTEEGWKFTSEVFVDDDFGVNGMSVFNGDIVAYEDVLIDNGGYLGVGTLTPDNYLTVESGSATYCAVRGPNIFNQAGYIIGERDIGDLWTLRTIAGSVDLELYGFSRAEQIFQVSNDSGNVNFTHNVTLSPSGMFVGNTFVAEGTRAGVFNDIDFSGAFCISGNNSGGCEAQGTDLTLPFADDGSSIYLGYGATQNKIYMGGTGQVVIWPNGSMISSSPFQATTIKGTKITGQSINLTTAGQTSQFAGNVRINRNLNVSGDIIMNGTMQWPETKDIQKMFYINPADGDGFTMEYWYNFELVNDDWMVFRKTDGNDADADGGIAFMFSNTTNNVTIIKIDGYGLANFTDYSILTEGNITSTGYYKGNGSLLTNVQTNSAYGDMFNFSDVGVLFVFPSSGAYYNITNTTCGPLNRVLCNASRGELTITETGTYKIIGGISGEGLSGGLYGFGVAKNYQNLEDQRYCYKRFTGTNTIPEVNCIVELVAGDTLNMMMDDEANPTKDLTIYTWELSASRIK